MSLSTPASTGSEQPLERRATFRLLDLFCAAGGASVGYHRAGFEVVGVDLAPQLHYPFEFHQGDAIEFAKEHGHKFDVITASPPCFVHSQLVRMLPTGHGHLDLIPDTRSVLVATGRPYVIENVEGAPLLDPLTLCGSMFGREVDCADGVRRQLRRHRWFESNVGLTAPSRCHHVGPSLGVHGGGPKRRAPRAVEGRGGYQGRMAERRAATGIDWMTRGELNLAIPPAYTEWLGRQLMAQVSA